MIKNNKINILCLIETIEDTQQEYFLELLGSNDMINLYFVSDNEQTPDVIITGEIYEGEVKKVLYITDSDKFVPRISPFMLENELVKISLKRFVGLDSSINIDNVYEGDFKNIKITDPFSVGYYQDILGAYLFKNGVEYKKLMTNYSKVVSYFLDTLECIPIEVDFVRGEDYVALQIHSQISKLQESKTDIIEFIQELDSDIVDSYYLKSSKEFVVNMIQIKEAIDKTILFSDLDKFNSTNPTLSFYENIESFVKIEKDQVDYSRRPAEKKSTIKIVRKVIDWLKDKKSLKGEYFDYDKELGAFPDEHLLKDLKSDDYDFIKKVVSDFEVDEAYKMSIAGATDDLSKDNELVSKLRDSLSNLEIYEVSSLFENEEDFIRVVGGHFEQSEESQKVEGVTDDVSEDSILVKGDGEGNSNDENILIEGSREKYDDLMKVKSKYEDVKQEISSIFLKRFNGESPNLEEIKEELNGLIVRKMGLTKEASERLSEKIISSAAVETSVHNNESQSRDEIFTKMQNEKLKNEIFKKDLVNKRMKELIDSMKEQLRAVREADKEILDSRSDDSEIEKQKMEQLLSFKTRELKARQITFERKEQVLLQEQRKNEKRIELLERKLSQANTLGSEAIKDNKENNEEISTLRIDNERMSNNIAVLEKKIDDLNSLYQQKISLIEAEAEKGISPEQFRAEQEKNKFLESKVSELEKKISEAPVATEINSMDTTELEEELKNMTLEVKKYEQKMKLLNGKILELEKSNQRTSSASSDAASGVKVKQLEKNLDKMREQKDKALKELADKKKEAHSYKQESSLLQNKVKDLERKLAKFEKKAA
ncbi:MAG: hypothetical protein VX341_09695 [Bdellovibrionota bacterium]|nr:hypothetical protein [Bdellovibrionota bacterium]